MTGPEFNRMPPQAVEVERAVLGAMILSPRAVAEAQLLLEPGDFYHTPHATIFAAIGDVHRYDGAVDQLTLTEYLKQTGHLDQIGGMVYISQLSAEVATGANITTHARIVLRAAQLRRLIELSTELTKRSYEGATDPTQIGEWALNKILTGLRLEGSRKGYSMAEIGAEVDTKLTAAMESPRRWAGLDTGFHGINDVLNGLCPEEFTVIGARPSVGKTRLALQMIQHIVLHEPDTWVLIFSIEMSRVQLYEYWACVLADLSLTRFRRGRLSVKEHQRFREARALIDSWPIIIDDASPLTLEQMYAATERHRAARPIKLVMIDYLQLMKGPGDSRNDVFDTISQGIKDYKKRFHLHVLVLSQLSRAVEARPDRRPNIGDLRDSGAIEQNADNVGLIYRPGAYEVLREKARKKGELDLLLSAAELQLEKVRFGAPCSVGMIWSTERAVFLPPYVPSQEEMDVGE